MKYPIKEELLDEWSPDLAYFLGLVISDGEVKHCGVIIDLQSDDVEVLEYIRDWISPTRPVLGPYFKKYRGKITEYRRLNLSSKSLAQKMQDKFGIMPCKTGEERISFEVPDAMRRHLIRGIFDGDGTIKMNTCKKNGTPKHETGFVSASRVLLEQIQELHGGNKGRSIRLKRDRRKTKSGKPRKEVYCWMFGLGEGAKLRDWMYEGEHFGMTRKKEKLIANFALKNPR